MAIFPFFFTEEMENIIFLYPFPLTFRGVKSFNVSELVEKSN